MAKLVYALNQSLDGYIDHVKLGPPEPAVYQHFVNYTHGLSGLVYGSRSYEIMRYWDEDQAGWGTVEHEFAAAWRNKPKWVVSNSLKAVGPNATLVGEEVEAMIRGLKAELEGEISIGGPVLAGSLTKAGLIDEYRIYIRPVVVGSGKPFFVGTVPPLRLVASDRLGENLVRLTYVPG